MGSLPNTMSRVCVSVEPSGFWAVQRYMEPLSSAGTRSSTSSFPSNSVLPSSRRLPTRVHVNMGSGKTSFCGPEQGIAESQGNIWATQRLPRPQFLSSRLQVAPQNPRKRARDVAELVACLPSTHKAPGFIPSTLDIVMVSAYNPNTEKRGSKGVRSSR